MRIGLTYTGSEEKHANYVRWLKASSADQEDQVDIIQLSPAANNLSRLKSCDALALSGGIDIHPELYGKGTGYKNAPDNFYRERDQFEMALFREAQRTHKPVLAICRGMQLINCIEGGTLMQDLGVSGNRIHRAEGLVDKAHGVTITPGSLLHKIAGGERAVVNSAHHQAIKKAGKGFRVNCVADDGAIEGIEWINPSGKPFFLGIQWHPERMFQFQLQASALAKAIRNRFMEEVKKRHDNHENN